jgi:CBS-domain-containing membrane protein
MRYGPKTLQHYLSLFAERHGITDPDVRAEIGELCQDFDDVLTDLRERVGALETYHQPMKDMNQAALKRGELHNLEAALYDIYTAGEYADGDTFVCSGEDARRLFAAFQALWPQRAGVV